MPFHDKEEEKDFSVQKRSKRKRKKSRKRLSSVLLVLFILAALSSACFVIFLRIITASLPTTDQILAHEPSLATIVYDRNGEVITQLFEENRTWVKFDKISPWLIKAVIASEDGEFYDHSGIRITAIARALIKDAFHLGRKQGGSTITQQLARNLFLTQEKTMVRKLKEIVLAVRLEKIYSKDQILEMYLNTVYFGHGAYGVDSASETFYGKLVSDLNITESATLVGIMPAPEAYTPFRNPDRARIRKEYVLKRMLDLSLISLSDYEASMAEEPKLAERHQRNSTLFLKNSPHFISHILFKQLLPTYGTTEVYRGGLRIHTTIDIDLQRKAEQLIASMKHEGALVALDPNTGEILALVGGRDFDSSKFNRATQAYRQPGSSFKPFVYATALEEGYRPIDHLLDAPLNFSNGWKPSNYSRQYAGEVTMLEAIVRSTNTVAVRLAQIDGVGNITNLARRVGITSPHFPEDLSIALGTPSVTPLEMATAYSAFANNGYRIEPYGVKQVFARSGESLEQTGPSLSSAISPATAVMLRSMLVNAATWGTGAKARIPGHETFGKTGTTNDWTDAWFAGGIPGLVVVVYVGNDNHTPLGGKQTGTIAAVPIWHEFVKYAVTKLNLPKRFVIPPDAGVEAISVCRQTGFLAAPGCTSTEILITSDLAPTSQCPWHGGDVAAAMRDSNAPQLLMAPIDDEGTRMTYAMNFNVPSYTTDMSTITTQPETPPIIIAENPMSRPTGAGKQQDKLPSASEQQPYKIDYSDPKSVEDAFQNLLRSYDLID